MRLHIKARYINDEGILSAREYPNGNIALTFTNKYGEPLATLSANPHNALVPEGHTCIKDYSENEGVLDSLIASKIVSEPVDVIPSGFVHLYVCKILKSELIDNQ